MFEVIAFDADDTLRHNESIFTMTQIKFREMLSSHGKEVVDQILFSTQIKNLQHFGYGIKGFILSMIETSIELTDGEVSGNEIQQILIAAAIGVEYVAPYMGRIGDLGIDAFSELVSNSVVASICSF